ncbi:unnamed protein product, partial [Aphanomyces euteiches]
KRQTFRTLSKATGLSTWTLWKYVKKRFLKRHSSWTKPLYQMIRRGSAWNFAPNSVAKTRSPRLQK